MPVSILQGFHLEVADERAAKEAAESDCVWTVLYGPFAGRRSHTACVFGARRFNLGDYWFWAKVYDRRMSTAGLRAALHEWEALADSLPGRLFAHCDGLPETRFLRWLGFTQYALTHEGRLFVRE